MAPLPSTPPDMASRLDLVVTVFEQLRPETLDHLTALYAPDARFKDPFNDVQGRAAIRRLFEHMFRLLEAPRFVVASRFSDGPEAVLIWELQFRIRGETGEHRLQGSSHLGFDANGAIAEHRDYWDAAEAFYERLPLVGSLLRWLKRRVHGA